MGRRRGKPTAVQHKRGGRVVPHPLTTPLREGMEVLFARQRRVRVSLVVCESVYRINQERRACEVFLGVHVWVAKRKCVQVDVPGRMEAEVWSTKLFCVRAEGEVFHAVF